MAGSNGFWVPVILLGISLIFVSINAFPITRLGRLMYGPQVLSAPDNSHMVIKEKSREERMMVEVNDYPGSGANNRHTPRPPQLGKCVDC